MAKTNNVAVLMFACRDQLGIINTITSFLLKYQGNIIELDQYVDSNENVFFLRLAWDLDKFQIPFEDIDKTFSVIAKKFDAYWRVKLLGSDIKTAVFVSKFDHCLHEILWYYQQKECLIKIPLIISNHPDLEYLAKQYNIPYVFFEINESNKLSQEQKQLKLLEEYEINNIVLARYMQILSKEFVEKFSNKIINIHHSFLPAFVGSNPYKKAYQRGVKIIGATSHYVTSDLDAGPIIDQDIIRVSHKDSVEDMIRKGKDLERRVLIRSLTYYAERRVLVFRNKTVVFA